MEFVDPRKRIGDRSVALVETLSRVAERIENVFMAVRQEVAESDNTGLRFWKSPNNLLEIDVVENKYHVGFFDKRGDSTCDRCRDRSTPTEFAASNAADGELLPASQYVPADTNLISLGAISGHKTRQTDCGRYCRNRQMSRSWPP